MQLVAEGNGSCLSVHVWGIYNTAFSSRSAQLEVLTISKSCNTALAIAAPALSDDVYLSDVDAKTDSFFAPLAHIWRIYNTA